MIKVVIFNDSDNLRLLEDYLKYNHLPYVVTKVNKDLYFEKYFYDDVMNDNLVLISDDMAELKREILTKFSLKNEISKFSSENNKYYFANSSTVGGNFANASFEDCTIPHGFKLVGDNSINSFYGYIENNLLLCLFDSKEDLHRGIEFLKKLYSNSNLPMRTTCLKMFFVDDKDVGRLKECLTELNCKGFFWAIYNDCSGLFALYLYYYKEISISSIVYIEKALYTNFNDNIYTDLEMTLPEIVVHMATISNLKIATVESLTGGLVSDTLISVSGASKILDCSFVTYANEAKVGLMGVSEESLLSNGAVSEDVARQMVVGLREKYGCDIGISTTGIAGPTGQTSNKPIGLVYVGVSTPTDTIVHKCNFKGDREQIRRRTTNFALFTLLRAIKKI